jgi:hypothetical protein
VAGALDFGKRVPKHSGSSGVLRSGGFVALNGFEVFKAVYKVSKFFRFGALGFRV